MKKIMVVFLLVSLCSGCTSSVKNQYNDRIDHLEKRIEKIEKKIQELEKVKILPTPNRG